MSFGLTNTSLNCKSRQIKLMVDDSTKLVITNKKSSQSRIVSALKAQWMIDQGCEAFLSHMVDTRISVPILLDIRVVRDFPDMFPKELSGLPLDRELKFRIEVWQDEALVFELCDGDVLYFRSQLYVPVDVQLRNKILHESGMKMEVLEFVTWYLVYQQVKAEHQVPSGLLQSIQIPQWKWDKVTMDFVIGLSMTKKRHDAVWVIVDCEIVRLS
ncbi:uncharacterized protein LOC120148130 [Hibiscus syriacus]|uniref:uncharacterized protein LOC120148130 n=1 Tax=Hibiscus syriacus TaxID=106335 RepID=UPI001924C0B7|nr:uncharacterized protein LOC120148130 [Hibiscus syriacus]